MKRVINVADKNSERFITSQRAVRASRKGFGSVVGRGLLGGAAIAGSGVAAARRLGRKKKKKDKALTSRR